jgi:hypothetical protein
LKHVEAFFYSECEAGFAQASGQEEALRSKRASS